MTKYDIAIRRFLCAHCEAHTFAARCEVNDFRIIFFETSDFGWRTIVINDYIPGLLFKLEHDDLEQETHLTIYRRDTECQVSDEEEGLTF